MKKTSTYNKLKILLNSSLQNLGDVTAEITTDKGGDMGSGTESNTKRVNHLKLIKVKSHSR